MVNYCCKLIDNLCIVGGGPNLKEEVVFGYLWKSRAPSMVLAFSWTLLLDRNPARMNIAKIGVLDAETSKNCIFDSREKETNVHLILHCEVVSKVCFKVLSWLELNFITPPNLFMHFNIGLTR